MLEFTLRPFIGADPITFDLTASEVAKVLGPPHRLVEKDELGERDERRGNVRLSYSSTDGKVAEITFVPGSRLMFEGRSLFEEKNLVDWLMTYDAHPYEYVGFLMFYGLGITVTGFHDDDDSQKGIGVYRKGRLDRFRGEAVPYKPN